MASSDPERLPPPFWRTRYFAESVIARPDRRRIDHTMISIVLQQPYRTDFQPDGRIRHWGWIPSLNRWLRVVTLPDGETVHTAFLDRDFHP